MRKDFLVWVFSECKSELPRLADLAVRWQQPRSSPSQVPWMRPPESQQPRKNSHVPPRCWHSVSVVMSTVGWESESKSKSELQSVCSRVWMGVHGVLDLRGVFLWCGVTWPSASSFPAADWSPFLSPTEMRGRRRSLGRAGCAGTYLSPWTCSPTGDYSWPPRRCPAPADCSRCAHPARRPARWCQSSGPYLGWRRWYG